MLLALASACPMICKLCFTGRVGLSFLRTFCLPCLQRTDFGASLTNIEPGTLEQLHILLPNVTSLCGQPSRVHYHNQIQLLYAHDDRQLADYIHSNIAAWIALLLCSNLQHLNTSLYNMTEENCGCTPAWIAELLHSWGWSWPQRHPITLPKVAAAFGSAQSCFHSRCCVSA